MIYETIEGEDSSSSRPKKKKKKIVAVISIMWIFGWKGPSGFSARSTAEEVTHGIDGTGLTAIVTGPSFC